MWRIHAIPHTREAILNLAFNRAMPLGRRSLRSDRQYPPRDASPPTHRVPAARVLIAPDTAPNVPGDDRPRFDPFFTTKSLAWHRPCLSRFMAS